MVIKIFTLGNMDQAFDYFEKADFERETVFVLTIRGPWYDKICSDPRYKALLKKMNLD